MLWCVNVCHLVSCCCYYLTSLFKIFECTKKTNQLIYTRKIIILLIGDIIGLIPQIIG